MKDLVTPLARQTLSQDVHAQLRSLLISGQLMPGEALSLRHIAAALQVSVMPVREAVHRLAAEQALDFTPNRSVRVPVMNAAQFDEVTRIRIELEGLATSQATALLDRAGVARIEQLNELLTREMSKIRPDGAKLVALNHSFHFAIYEAARMPTLQKFIETLWLRVGPILNHDLRSGSRRVKEQVAVRHHAALLDAMRRRDGQAAALALRGDIEGAAAYIRSAGVLKEGPGSAG